jgi:hypothetical protein
MKYEQYIAGTVYKNDNDAEPFALFNNFGDAYRFIQGLEDDELLEIIDLRESNNNGKH